MGADGQQLTRVNTGFFVIRTTPLARDFIERAWQVNDCGRGESDQRSMNFVLGRVNADDESCSADGAQAEWASLMARHGGESCCFVPVRVWFLIFFRASGLPWSVGRVSCHSLLQID